MREISPLELQKLVKEFKIKVIGKKVGRFGYQKLTNRGFGYDWVNNREPSINDLVRHFRDDAIQAGPNKIAALAFLPADTEGVIRRVVIDADNQQLKDICYNKVIPKYQELGIDYIVEHGGDNNDRCHLSFLTETKKDVIIPFMRQLMAEVGEPVLTDDESFLKKKVELKEVYGVNKLSTLIRAPYGFHLKRGKRFHMEYRGEILDDYLSVIETFIKMETVSEDYMKSYIKPGFFPEKAEKVKIEWRDQFKYEPLNLPSPDGDIPYKLKPVFSNCQALNTLLSDTYENGFIEEPGNDHHNGGLVFADMANYHDHKFNSTAGKEWFDKLVAENRDRDAKSHNWWNTTERMMTGCEKMAQNFGRCNGCPFREQISSPSAFIFGLKITRNYKEVVHKAYSLKEIRENHFPRIKKMIIEEVRDLWKKS